MSQICRANERKVSNSNTEKLDYQQYASVASNASSGSSLVRCAIRLICLITLIMSNIGCPWMCTAEIEYNIIKFNVIAI